METTVPNYETTDRNIEALDREPRLRWKLSQTQKGIRWSEFTVRGDDIEELEQFSKKVITKLKEIEVFANGV